MEYVGIARAKRSEAWPPVARSLWKPRIRANNYSFSIKAAWVTLLIVEVYFHRTKLIQWSNLIHLIKYNYVVNETSREHESIKRVFTKRTQCRRNVCPRNVCRCKSAYEPCPLETCFDETTRTRVQRLYWAIPNSDALLITMVPRVKTSVDVNFTLRGVSERYFGFKKIRINKPVNKLLWNFFYSGVFRWCIHHHTTKLMWGPQKTNLSMKRFWFCFILCKDKKLIKIIWVTPPLWDGGTHACICWI